MAQGEGSPIKVKRFMDYQGLPAVIAVACGDSRGREARFCCHMPVKRVWLCIGLI